jgi:hypothetical protein
MGMALRALRAVPAADTTSTEPTSATFAVAKARWERAGDERRRLKARLDGAQAALALAASPPGKGDHPSPRLVELANAHLGGRRSASVPALQAEIVEIDDQLRRAATAYTLERVAWEQAVAVEARRLAAALRPAQKAACRRIAKAVEELSAAIEEERRVRSKLVEVGCTEALPDAGREFGALSEFNSTLSTWNRRVLQAGLLDP